MLKGILGILRPKMAHNQKWRTNFSFYKKDPLEFRGWFTQTAAFKQKKGDFFVISYTSIVWRRVEALGGQVRDSVGFPSEHSIRPTMSGWHFFANRD